MFKAQNGCQTEIVLDLGHLGLVLVYCGFSIRGAGTSQPALHQGCL